MWRDTVDEWRDTAENGVIWLMYGAIRLMNDAIPESVASYDLGYKKKSGHHLKGGAPTLTERIVHNPPKLGRSISRMAIRDYPCVGRLPCEPGR